MIIDVHAHVVPERFPILRAGMDEGWPEMDHFEPGRARIMIAGRNFRTVTEGVWSAQKRLEDMESDGVDAQVISPMPELLSYWLPVEDATAMAEWVNVYIATMVAERPGRFYGLGMVPLQEPDAAARALEDVAKAGLKGIEVGSNILGRSLGDERFWPSGRSRTPGHAVFVTRCTLPSATAYGSDQVENAVGFPPTPA
jgi:aminocarboxymuconate-semialdehyde decarboxylase